MKGLYLAGASTHPGAGVPSVLSSAKVVDKLVPEASLWRAGLLMSSATNEVDDPPARFIEVPCGSNKV